MKGSRQLRSYLTPLTRQLTESRITFFYLQERAGHQSNSRWIDHLTWTILHTECIQRNIRVTASVISVKFYLPFSKLDM